MRPSETLQNYLDDLLFDADDSLGDASNKPALPAGSKPKPIELERSQETEVSTDLEIQLYLAEEKKRQLQQLLMPSAIAEDPIVEESITENVIESKKINQASQNTATSSPSLEIKTNVVNVKHTSPADAELGAISLPETNLIDKFLTWGENGRPVWAQNKFDALLFEVSGLTLAVPLIALGQIVNMSSDKLTPLFGRSEWFMGLLTTPFGQMRVINTALFVMPERYKASFLESIQYVISMDGQPWGLAVDSVTQPIRLDPDDVKWRSERTSRPWLAGTVKSKMCALIDIPQMAKLLNTPTNAMPQ